jgi:tetratricopeptide (TPR) repeat protein
VRQEWLSPCCNWDSATLIEIAHTFAEQENYSAARSYGERALSIIQSIEDIDIGSHAYSVLAKIHHQQGNHHSAVEFARQAARLAERCQNALTEAEALHVLGHALHDLGHLESARENWLHSAAIYSDMGHRDRVYHIERDLADAASSLESLPEPRTPDAGMTPIKESGDLPSSLGSSPDHMRPCPTQRSAESYPRR